MTKYLINNSILELVKGDITNQDTEAIVNAANKRLAPGGGVAGAIHRRAGPLLWKECQSLGGCQTGQAKITKGYNLPNRYIIHTVGPVYSGKEQDKIDLKACYINSLQLAQKNNISSISFPAISTGTFGYPVEEASQIAFKTIIDYLKRKTTIKIVRMVIYEDYAFEIHKQILKRIVND